MVVIVITCILSDAGRATGEGGGEESQVGIDALMKELDAHTPRLASSSSPK